MEYLDRHLDLINLCRKQDQKAQFRLYKIYYKSMYNTSYRIVGNADEAEDIMQEAFLLAFKKIDSFSGKVSFGAWLQRIVVNKSIDCIRKRKYRFIPIEENDSDFSEEINDYDIAEENLKLNSVKRAIEQLPEGYRIVLSLHLLEGYDYEEIADILQISNSTARSQYARARGKLLMVIKNNSNNI